MSFSLYGSDHQAFLTPFRPKYQKLMHSGVKAKASSLQIKQISTFPVHYELSPCKDGRFNMETLRAGRILMPKRPIAANHYWIGLRARGLFQFVIDQDRVGLL